MDRLFAVHNDEKSPFLIRDAATSLILGSGQINSIRVRCYEQTGNWIVQSQPTFSMIEVPIVVSGDLADGVFRCDVAIGGVTFVDSTTKVFLTAKDFDAFGTVKVLFLAHPNSHSNCYNLSLWQKGNRISGF